MWTGETVEWLTGQLTFFAMPSIAILILKAGPFDIGVLNALDYAAFPLLGAFIGVLSDRWPRRPMMFTANIVQVAALGSIPIAFLFGSLTLYHLFAVALVMGTSAVFFVVAYQAYLPTLVRRENLTEGNSKLTTSESAAQVGGRALAGPMMQLFGPSISFAIDALGTLLAAAAIFSISTPEKSHASSDQRNFLRELREGAEVIFNDPLLRSLAASTATWNLGISIFNAVFFLFMYNELKLSLATAALVLAIGSIGVMVGAVISPEVAEKLGLGRTLAVSLLIGGVGLLAVPIVLYGPAAPILAAVWFFQSIGIPIYNVNQISFRQAIVPNRLQGRMNATMRTIIWSTIPIGAFAGGIVGTLFGIVPTILIGAIVCMLPVLLIALGPLGSLSKIPEHMQPVEELSPGNIPSL